MLPGVFKGCIDHDLQEPRVERAPVIKLVDLLGCPEKRILDNILCGARVAHDQQGGMHGFGLVLLHEGF